MNVLAKIRGLRVASRTSAFSFKGKDVDIPTAAQNLNVANILEGSVRTAGKRVRITAQLIEAATDSHLWSNTYDRELDDIFAVQDDIAQSVVKELRHTLLGEQTQAATSAQVKAEVIAAAKGRSENAEAYRFYLQGQFFRDHFTREGAAKAVECYEQALKLDPEYALAWAGLSRACVDQAGQNWTPRGVGFPRARMAAERAIELEPNLAEGYTALGWVQNQADWDWKGAEASFGRALELAPGSTLAMNGAATLAGNLGRLDEAVALFRRAVQPTCSNVALNRNVGLYGLAAGAAGGGGGGAAQDVAVEPAGRAHQLLARPRPCGPGALRRGAGLHATRGERSIPDGGNRRNTTRARQHRRIRCRAGAADREGGTGLLPIKLPRPTGPATMRSKPSSGWNAPTRSATPASPI